MSLNARERRQTAHELRTNLEATGLSDEQMRRRAGLSEARMNATLTVDNADPLDVWRLRDAIADALDAAAESPAASERRGAAGAGSATAAPATSATAATSAAPERTTAPDAITPPEPTASPDLTPPGPTAATNPTEATARAALRAVPFTVLTDDKRAAARAWFGYEG